MRLEASNPVLPDVHMDRTKPVTAEIERGAKHVFSRWSALARIDVTELDGSQPTIFIDAAAATPVTPPRTREHAEKDLGSVACQLRPGCSIAVIGAGGGVDIQNALAMGARSIGAIEINPIILDLLRDRYSGYTNAPYDNPRVREVQDEGRSFIARSRDHFDVIQLTLIDTWAASVSGAYSLSENYLYTVERSTHTWTISHPTACSPSRAGTTSCRGWRRVRDAVGTQLRS